MIGVTLLASNLPAQPLVTAWQQLAAEAPDETSVVSPDERQMLQILTPEQAQAYAAGQNPSSILLPNGETLMGFLERREHKRTMGLLLRPIEPCVLFDQATQGRQSLILRRAENDGGCGVPDPEGDIFKSHRTRALWISLQVSEAAGEGKVRLWPGGGVAEPVIETLAFSPTSEALTIPTFIVPICDEESFDPCSDGDLNLAVEGATARIKLVLHGLLEPAHQISLPARTSGSEVGSKIPEAKTGGVKALGDSPWLLGASDSIHYLDGHVGIGTSTPNSQLVVTSDSAVGGWSKAAVTIDAAAATASEWALSLRASTDVGEVNNLMVVRGNGSVGIGTTTPSTDLHVAGQGFFEEDIILGDNAMIRGERALGTVAAGGAFFNSATPGSQGINLSPGYQAYTLHNLYWDGSQWLQPRGSMYSQAFTVGHHYDTSWWRATPSGTNGSPVQLTQSMIIKRNSGNVGIGSKQPASRFVVSNNNFSGHVDWASAIDSRTSDASTGILNLRNSSAASVFFARSDGRVGIGTTSPTSTLEVDGNVKVDGDLQLSGNLVSAGDICIGQCG